MFRTLFGVDPAKRVHSTFVLGYDHEIPKVMTSFAKLLLLPENEWEKVREKSKPPKPKLEGVLCDILISVIENRLAEYPTTLEVRVFHTGVSLSN